MLGGKFYEASLNEAPPPPTTTTNSHKPLKNLPIRLISWDKKTAGSSYFDAFNNIAFHALQNNFKTKKKKYRKI